MSSKTGSVCIAAKNGQGVFLVTEKWAVEKQAGRFTLLKVPRGNATKIDECVRPVL